MGLNNGSSVAAPKPRVGGGLYYAPVGTPLPTDASTTLSAAYIKLGPISEDGVQPARDTSTEKPKEWSGKTLAQLLTDESRSFVFKLYGAFDVDVLNFVYGAANVTAVAAVAGTSGQTLAVLDKGGKPDQCVLVFEMAFEGLPIRKIAPVADCVVTGEDPWVGSALTAYEITAEALDDDTETRMYEYAVGKIPPAA